jgi:acyl-CoA synthetase (AMP-forming)/AMP-acid ligase II
MLDVRSALRRAMETNRNRTAIMAEDIELTFEQAWKRGCRMANALRDMGLQAGDKIAVLEDNCLEASDFFLASAIGNFVRVPLYRRNSAAAHAHMIGHTDCRAVVVSAEYAHEVLQFKEELDGLKHVIARGDDYEEWLAKQSDTDPDIEVDINDPHLIRHSGGTTGRSKGMQFSHKQWMRTCRDWSFFLPRIEAGDYGIHVGPISHGSGYLFMPVWLAGGCNILIRKFEPQAFANLLETYGGYTFAVPTMLSDMVANSKAKKDFSKVRGIMVSGAPIRPATALQARDFFGDVLFQLYGQTESVPVAGMGPREWFSDVPGSEPLLAVGKIMPYSAIEIRDENNKPLPAGQIGEIALKCEGQITEILNEPELTRERLVDGWVLSGDVGKIDENGYVYLTDRKDDMIISGGFNIWPAELENVISSLEGVREVAVVAAPHDRWGEVPAAVVVVKEGASVSEDDIVAACKERLGSYKRPGRVILQDDPLPRTPVGKIQRKAVRERFWEGEAGRHINGA